MKLLQELLTISEADVGPAGTGPLELKALAKYYAQRPDDLKKKLNQHWGSDRLVYHGMKFFDGNTLGEAYDKADEAVKEYLKDYTVEINLPLEPFELEGKEIHWDDFEYEAGIDDSQEVYLGYSPRDDHLYMGVDAWLIEDDFNEAWDREFKKHCGVEFDDENPEHAALFNKVWKQYIGMKGYGILMELTSSGKDFNVEVVETEQGGFYGGIYRSAGMKRHGLVDIRLD
jgi:hypothetical protein